MLQKTLQGFWDSNKFATSWIIGTKNLPQSLQNIKDFAQKITDISGLSIDNNPDFRLIKREETKYIGVDQIRDLQKFLYTTSTVGEYKFAVIYEAELMNNNASNCCLKILEEPPRQSYLFLLTSGPANLSATIKSRCHKLILADEYTEDNKVDYAEFIESLLKMNITQKIKWLQDISSKSKHEVWQEFCQNSIWFLSDRMRYGKNNNYSFVKYFENIQKMIKDTSDFDLDKRQMGILILESLGKCQI